MAIASIVFSPLAGSEALVAASTADSKAVVADSKGVSAGALASEAESEAVVADSKAVSVGVVAGSAIGSEPSAGQYKITDMKRGADGSIVVEYDDSAIGS